MPSAAAEVELSGFAAMGSRVPNYRRDAAYQWLRSIGIDREQSWSTVVRMAECLERDEPHVAMKAAEEIVDLTGAYRLMALLLASAL